MIYLPLDREASVTGLGRLSSSVHFIATAEDRNLIPPAYDRQLVFATRRTPRRPITMPTLDLSNFNIVVSLLGGWVSLFGLVSFLLKETFYLSEARESRPSGITPTRPLFCLANATASYTNYLPALSNLSPGGNHFRTTRS